jgi:hypothetical protein
MDRIFHEELCPYRGYLIRCQNDHGDYTCSRGGVVMSDDDGTDLSTQVPIARYA